MSQEYTHNGHKYWIKVEPALNQEIDVEGFVAFVSDSEPTEENWGFPLRDQEGKVIFFIDINSALINAQAVKQSELDSKNSIGGFI